MFSCLDFPHENWHKTIVFLLALKIIFEIQMQSCGKYECIHVPSRLFLGLTRRIHKTVSRNFPIFLPGCICMSKATRFLRMLNESDSSSPQVFQITTQGHNAENDQQLNKGRLEHLFSLHQHQAMLMQTPLLVKYIHNQVC